MSNGQHSRMSGFIGRTGKSRATVICLFCCPDHFLCDLFWHSWRCVSEMLDLAAVSESFSEGEIPVPRFIPPHLMALVVLLIVVLWFMFVHRIRRSTMLQRFISEAFGDDTPENALVAFDAAKQRMADHLKNRDLDLETRRQIEIALGIPLNREVIDCCSDNRTYQEIRNNP